jgi:WD40-like Beta Propeller Repeat.
VRGFFTLIILLLLSIPHGFAQKVSYYKRVFVDAEYYVLYDEYKDALPLYKELYKAGKTNANICYRIGQCFINIPGEKEKAIAYLEKASSQINSSYKEGYFTETSAPREAFLLLGNAYRIAGEFSKAKTAYESYQVLLKPEDTKQRELVNQYIKCINNIIASAGNIKHPVETNLGSSVNSSFPEVRPCISGNGQVIAYTSIQRFYNAIFISRIGAKGQWLPAKNVTAEVGAEGAVYTCSLSFDGKILLFTRNDVDDFNIYMSKYDSTYGKWGAMERLSKNINSRFFEMDASLSKDGKTLYFSSNRDGGLGGFDLYKSVLNEQGEWGEAINLGSNINTPFDEDSPALTNDGHTLFFSSNGHDGFGGFDMYKAEITGDSITHIQNLGYGINTTDDDIFFSPLDDGQTALVSKRDPNGYGDYDLIIINIEP